MKRHYAIARTVGIVLATMLLGATVLSAQTGTGVIVGTLSDASGATLAGVRVTATNTDTGQSVSVTTGQSGDYRIPGLLPGPYEIRADKESFSTEVRRGIKLTVSQQVEINLAMKIGELKQEVVVSGAAPLVENVTSSVSGLVEENQMEQLPLNGRDIYQLVLLQPGVVPNPSAGPSPWQKGGVARASVNGQRPTSNNLTIDGMDANEPNYNITPGGAAGVLLGVDAIKEFRIFTDTYSAEYGRNAGSIIQMVTKSGTNRLHGSLFEFHRNAALDAKNYFDLPNQSIPPFIRNQFGASLGGPIKQDKAFFFVSYEGFREGQGQTAVSTVPNALAHQGLLPSASDPGACTPATPAGCVNIGVNPQIAPFMNIIAMPNGTDFGNGSAQITSTQRRITNENYGMGRFDYSLSNTHSIFARYIYDGSTAIVPYLSTLVPGFPGLNDVTNEYATIQDQKIFSPNVLNVLAFGFNRSALIAQPDNSYPGLSTSLLANRPIGVISIAGLGAVGNNLIYPLTSFSNTFQFQDNLSWNRGKHALKFGGEYRRVQINGPFDIFVNGEYVFADLTPFGVPALSNNPALEFFLDGVPEVFVGSDPAKSNSNRGLRQNWIAGYAQDDWRITPRLTLNFGVRYEFYSNPTEVQGKEANIRNIATDTTTTVGKFIDSTPKDLITPRFGFAWNVTPDGKTVLRGGVGAFNDQIWGNIYSNARSLPPFYQAFIAILPQFQNPLTAAAVSTTANATLTYFPKWPMIYQYNLNLQREVTSTSVVKFAYIGARGNHLGRTVEANPFEASLSGRPNPNFGSLLRYLTDGQSFYNAFQASFEQRTSKGLSFQINYSYSHSIDDSSGYNPSDAVNEAGVSQDINDRIGSRGRSGFDIRHNLTLNFLYELPIGPGKAVARDATGGLAKVLGGWQLAGIGAFHSNVPFTPVLGFDNANIQSVVSFTDRPNLTGNPFAGTCPNGSPVGTVTCWFNPTAYTLSPANTFGDAGRNSLPGPNYKDFDLSLLKNTAITERTNLEFRVECFNLFNHPNFAVPANTTGPNGSGGNGDAVILGRDGTGNPIYAPNAGQIFSTVSSSRQIQFGLKFTF